MEIVEMKAEKRDIGKRVVKKMRTGGKIPAIFYGRGVEPLALSVDAKTFRTVIHGEAGTNVILKLNVEGKREGQTAIIKEIQRNPVKDSFLHVDFLKIAMDEKIQAQIPVNVIGEAVGVKEGGVLQHGLWEVEVEALPKDLPEHIEMDVADLQIGDTVRIADLTVPEGVEILSDPEETVVSVVPPTELKEEELVAEEVAEPEIVGAEEAKGEVAEEKAKEVKEEAEKKEK
jgi:large subunit ribosomal protein L25